MGVFPVTSSIVFLLVVASGIHGYNSEFPPRLCAFLTNFCMRQFQSTVEGFAQGREVHDIDSACQLVKDGKNCMGGCLTYVAQSAPYVRAGVRVVDYFCDESRRDVLRRLGDVECFHDGSLMGFEAEAEQCMQNVTSELDESRLYHAGDIEQEICRLVDQVLDCVDDKVEDMCGQEAVPIFSDLIKIIYEEMRTPEMPDCFGQLSDTHAILKRAVDYIKTFRK